jgi:CubicO group peptidase (beta-lactamase class C family)
VLQPKRLTLSIALCLFTMSSGIDLAQAQKPGQMSLAQTRKETTPPKSAKETRAVETKLVPAPDSTAHELTGADLEAFLDGMMPSQLQRENVAGAAIAVVKDGKLIFAKGYGFSDVEKRTPVTADSTLFRPGSISKLFTWTSVMQLAEQGKLDLDKDVNEYLDFKIPPAYGKPITLKNIMTHTAGFEELGRDLFVSDAQHLHSLEQFLKHHVPERIFPPGIVPAYSNYATALAGYIVQRVSGKSFDQYAQENIFSPLDMHRTTFVQPLPENLKPFMSNGYKKASEKVQPFEFVEAYPAGSISTTAKDMSNFMVAHLQNGKFGDQQILKPETAKQMHSRLYGTDDRLNAMAYGFYEESRNGKRIIGHGGDTVFFHSDLHLILDEDVGFFVSYNSAGQGETSPRTILFEAFLDRYFPFTPSAGEKAERAAADAKEIAGFYKSSRRFDSSFLTITTPLGEPHVIANADGTISVDPLKGPNGELKKFEEIAPFLYREVHGQDHIGFKKDSAGRWQFQLDYPFFVFQKVGIFENKFFSIGLLIFGLGVLGLTILLWPVAAMIRKHYGKQLDYSPSDARMRLLVRIICILLLVFHVGWLSVLSLADDPNAINSLPPWIIAFGLLGIVCTIGTIFVLWNAARSLRNPGRWIWTKLHDLVVALACLGLVWFAFTWNLMNFNIHY